MIEKNKNILLTANKIQDLPVNVREELEILMISILENDFTAEQEEDFKILLKETSYVKKEFENFKNIEEKVIKNYETVFNDSSYEKKIQNLINQNTESHKEEAKIFSIKDFKSISFLKDKYPNFISSGLRMAATLVIGVFIGSSFLTEDLNNPYSMYKSIDIADDYLATDLQEITENLSTILDDINDLEVGGKQSAQFGRSGNSLILSVKEGKSDICKIVEIEFRGLDNSQLLNLEYCKIRDNYVLDNIK